MPRAWSGLGADYAQIGDMERSAAAYATSLALQPGLPGIHMSHAHALKSLGRQAEALREYRAAVALKPEFGEVYWSMANLKVFRFEPQEVAAMEEQLEREDLSESAARAFPVRARQGVRGRGRLRPRVGILPRRQPAAAAARILRPGGLRGRATRAIAEVFSREFLRAARRPGTSSRTRRSSSSGLPRSGSTLIEQILASHSQVEGTLELPDARRDCGVDRPLPARGPANIRKPCASCAAGTFAPTGSNTSKQTRIYRTTGKPRFTDKLPNNFSHVGFAHLILPNARIINARRHPLDSCLGSYKQLFGKGQNFTYDMHELALYYRQYHETMRHWHHVLPGKVLDVHYEETVGDLEAQVRRILAHCGLPFEEACLRFHETQRAVRTASSEQVRQPLYTRALGTWRRYEKHLGPWQEELADIIAELPESVRNAGL